MECILRHLWRLSRWAISGFSANPVYTRRAWNRRNLCVARICAGFSLPRYRKVNNPGKASGENFDYCLVQFCCLGSSRSTSMSFLMVRAQANSIFHGEFLSNLVPIKHNPQPHVWNKLLWWHSDGNSIWACARASSLRIFSLNSMPFPLSVIFYCRHPSNKDLRKSMPL